MSITLRPYQTSIIDQTRGLMRRGCKSILITSPTGSGKTALTAHMLHTAASRGMGSWFVVHRRELVNQSARAFALEGLPYGIIASGFEENRNPLVQIASVQTLLRRFKRHRPPRLIVWDEAHHLAARSWRSLFSAFPDSFHIGLTATPTRLDGKGLGDFFKELLLGPSVSWLMENGYLSRYKLYAPTTVAMDGVHIRMGDYEKRELTERIDKPSITGDVVDHYRRLCLGRRAVVFCVSIDHSKRVASAFQSAGIAAEHVDGETDPAARDAAIQRFAAGSLQILSNVEIFGEGFDVPAIDAAILLRPTQSLGYYLQQVGRSLRPCEGKGEAVILDHVGNWSRHGLPDDDRTWSLLGIDASRGRGESRTTVRLCKKCFAAQPAGGTACRFCGCPFEIEPRQVEEREGELEEIQKDQARKQARQTQGRAQSFEDLVRIGKMRNMKNPYGWAHFVMQGRELKRRREQAARLGKYV